MCTIAQGDFDYFTVFSSDNSVSYEQIMTITGK